MKTDGGGGGRSSGALGAQHQELCDSFSRHEGVPLRYLRHRTQCAFLRVEFYLDC